MSEKKDTYIDKIRKFLYQNIIAIRSTPHDLALGLAIGVFVGFLPIMGFQTVVSVPIAIMLRASKVTSAIGVWISNPVTFIPFYYFNFRVGRWLIGNPEVEWSVKNYDTLWKILELGWEILYPLWFGCIVLGVLSLPVVYFSSYKFIVFYRLKHNRKSEKNESE